MNYIYFPLMEFQTSYSVLFTFICFLLLILKSNSKKNTKKLPPGPPKLPLIGNIHHLLGSLPHQSLRNLAKKYGPLMHLQLGETPHLIVSSPETAKEILKTHDLVFANRPYLFAYEVFSYNAANIGFSSYGKYWLQLRKICNAELLSPKRVQSFRFIREEEVAEIIKTISANEGSVINLSGQIMRMTSMILARAAIGKMSRDLEAFMSCADKALDMAGGFYVADFFPSFKMLQKITGMEAKIESVHREIDGILENIIRDHREKKCNNGDAEEDLVDVFLKILEQNDLEVPITLDNIKAVILDVFIAGTETSSVTLIWAMSEILRKPWIMEKAQNEVRSMFGDKGYVDEAELNQLKYLQSIIKETLRLHPPAPFLIPRQNNEKQEVNGYEIPAKTKILVNSWAINRDPRYWTEPDQFKPERFLDSLIDYNFRGTNFEYIPFGGGRRICPGISFATPNLELPLANFLYHFDWKLPNGMKLEELDMTELFAGTVRKKSDLCLIPACYRP